VLGVHEFYSTIYMTFFEYRTPINECPF